MDIKVNRNTVIVFDLDDTLYNEIDYLISAYKKIANYLDIKNEKKLFSIIFSLYRNNQNVFDFLEKKYLVDKKLMLEIYRTHLPEIKLDNAAMNILKKIKEKKGKIAIITDGRSVTQRNKIKALELFQFVDYISISEEVGEEKPSVMPFELVMKELVAEEYFYIADNVKKDFIAPNNLKWKTIGVIDSGKNIHSNAFFYQVDEQLPDSLVYSINDIKII